MPWTGTCMLSPISPCHPISTFQPLLIFSAKVRLAQGRDKGQRDPGGASPDARGDCQTVTVWKSQSSTYVFN